MCLSRNCKWLLRCVLKHSEFCFWSLIWERLVTAIDMAGHTEGGRVTLRVGCLACLLTSLSLISQNSVRACARVCVKYHTFTGVYYRPVFASITKMPSFMVVLPPEFEFLSLYCQLGGNHDGLRQKISLCRSEGKTVTCNIWFFR
jgi:hypothetical protein